MQDKTKDVREQSESNKSRRRVLKKAGVATSVVAASAWVKPSLNSVILPAHAQMSMAVMMGGGTSTTPVVSSSKNRFNNIANKALNAVIPEAHAGTGLDGGICPAFTQNGDDNTHCISLQLDEAADNAGFTLTLSGPPVYYNFCGTDYNSPQPYYAYYEGIRSFGGTVSDMLDGKDILISMGDLTFEGTVDDSFESASGVLFINNRDAAAAFGSPNSGGTNFCSSGYGAYWQTSATGAACMIGTGVNSSNRPRVKPSVCEE